MAKSALSGNPLRKLRTAMNLTQQELAEKLELSPNTIYLAEHGVYDLPLEAVAQFFCRERGTDLAELNSAYGDFRIKIRESMKNKMYEADWRFNIPHAQVSTFRTPLGTKMAPVADFRTNCLMYSVIDFCKSFLVNPGLYHKLEVGSYFKTVPVPITKALVDCGAPVTFMKELDVRTKIFFDSCKRS